VHCDRKSAIAWFESLHPASNFISASFRQSLKQHGKIASIDEGRQIDWSEEQFSNADSPRIKILEPASKANVERAVHPQKQTAPMVARDEGN
jgi:hypothetical protein